MIRFNAYSSLLEEMILIEAHDTEMLEKYITITKEFQSKCPSDSETWRGFQILIDAYEETLDLLNRGELNYDV